MLNPERKVDTLGERDMSAIGGRKRLSLSSSLLGLSLLVLLAAKPADSPVADAAEQGDTQIVRTLLQQGEDVNAAQSDGLTALHWAALNNDVEMAKLLLYAGATVKPMTRVGGYTPLHLASRSGYSEVMRAMLDAGADPNKLTSTGVTAMHFAAQSDAPEAIRVLAEHRGDLNMVDGFFQRTPLMFAAVKNATRALEALVELGSDLEMVTRVKDYVEFAEETNADRTRRNRVRDAEKDPDSNNAGSGRGGSFRPQTQNQNTAATPPDSADNKEPDEDEKAEPDEDEEVEPDEDEKAEPDPPAPPPVRSLSGNEQIGNQGGFTALHFAAREGHIEVARQLVDGGAEIDHVTEGDQSSPLLVAVINGNYDLARMLLEQGADPNVLSDDGAGPLFATLNIEWSLRTWYPQPSMFRQQETSYLELAELLMKAGAEPNQRVSTHIWYAAYNAGRMGVDFTGATPFWRASYAHDVNAMKLLVAYGADPNTWTQKLPSRRRYTGPMMEPDTTDQDSEPVDPSGLDPVPDGGLGIHPLHAAAGVGFGTSRVAQQHRGVPDGWLPAIRYLIEEHGIDPDLRDMDGFSAIHHAAARGDNETILYLVRNGADVTLISRRGQTTADLANSPEQRAQPHPKTVVLLEKLGSKNNHQCRTCGTGG